MSNATVTPLTTTIGARVDGVDLREPLDEAAAGTIRAALAKHSVLAFPRQFIDLAQQKAFARIFGELEQVLTHKLAGNFDTMAVIDNELYRVAATKKQPYQYSLQDQFQRWHVDNSYCPQINAVSVLRAEVLPPVGGGTCWASMAAAYEAMSPSMQGWLETLFAVHAAPAGQQATMRLHTLPLEEQERWHRESARLHPVVVVHPITGRKGLFVNPGSFTTHIHGVTTSESALLMRYLHDHSTRAEFVYRHLWSEGDILVWDQLATVHLAPTDHYPHDRRVVRVSAGLTTPTGVHEAPAPPAMAMDAA